MLAGVFASQLTSFVEPGACIPLVLTATAAASVTGRLPAWLLFIAGGAIFVIEAQTVIDQRISDEFVGDSIMTTVRVTSFPKSQDGHVSFEADVPDSRWVPRRIRVTWREPPHEVRVGNVWHLELRLKRPRGASNPGGFDYERWLFRERIGAVGFVVAGGRNRLLGPGDPGGVTRFRQAAVDRLIEVIPDRDRAAVIAAISIGTRHLVDARQWERYAQTGTSHLMAISGLHVGMLASVSYLMALAVFISLGGSRHQHRIATLVAFTVACLYGLLSGLAVPAQRAITMIGLAAFSLSLNRPVRPFRVLAVTALLVTVCDPLSTLSPGFVMSFLAVLLLVWVARQHPPAGSRLHGLAQLFRVQWALLLGLLPATILLFERLAVMAPIVNLMAVPIFSIVTVPFSLLGLLLDGTMRPLGDVLLEVSASSLAIVEALIDLALAVPSPGASVPVAHGWRLVLIWIPVAWIALPAGWPGRAAAWIAALALITAEPQRPEPGCAEVTVLDVGQGLATSVLTRSSSLLFDTGPGYFSGKTAADTIVLPYLRRLGIRELDRLVISHADLDHAGGISAILGQLTVRRVYAGEHAGGPIAAIPCIRGHGFRQDRVRFEFLHPGSGEAWDGNNASCVLQITAGTHRLLLTGDIEQAAEAGLVDSGSLERVDVVVVPHHGSRTSSTTPFVNSLRPSTAIVSAGYDNRWGQPDHGVVERWRAVGATVLNTATSGAISLVICSDGVTEPVQNRVDRRRIWHE